MFDHIVFIEHVEINPGAIRDRVGFHSWDGGEKSGVGTDIIARFEGADERWNGYITTGVMEEAVVCECI